MNRANLKRRVLTGMLGGSLLLLSALHELSYLSVFVVIIFLSSREYYKILSNNGFKPNYNLGVFLSVVIFVTTYFYTSNESLIGIHFVLVPILPLVCLSALYSSDNHQTLSNVSVTFFGILYISLPISLLNFIVFSDYNYTFPFYHYLANKFLSNLFSLLHNQKISDIEVGYKFFKSEIFKKLEIKKMILV